MKIKFLFLFIIIYQRSFSQIELKEFAPLGAIWSYWDATFGGGDRNFTWITRPSDTIVQGIKFKRFDNTNVDYIGNWKYGYRILKSKPNTTYFNIIKDTHYIYNEGKIFKYQNMDTIGCKIIPFQDSCFLGDTLCFTLKHKFFQIKYNYKYIVRVYSNNKDSILDTAYSYDAPAFWSYLSFLYDTPKNYKPARHKNNNCGSAAWFYGGVFAGFSCYFDSIVGFIPFDFGFCEFLFKPANASIEELQHEIIDYRIIDNSQLYLLNIRQKKIKYNTYNSLGTIFYKNLIYSNPISIEHLPPGVYFMSIETDSEQKLIKFIKE